MALDPIPSPTGEYMKIEDQGSQSGARDDLIVLNFFIGKGNNNTGLFFFQDISEIRKDSDHVRVWSWVTMASDLLGLSGLCTCGYLALATWCSHGGSRELLLPALLIPASSRAVLTAS